MAETRVVGFDGAAAVTGHNALLSTWSQTINQVVTDVTEFGDTWANKRGGLKSGRGSAGGAMHFDAAAADQAPNADTIAAAGAAITLTVAPSCTYTGTAVLSGVDIGSTVDGAASVSFNFEYTGAVVEAWVET